MADIQSEELSPIAVLLTPQGYLDRPLGQEIKNRVRDSIAAGKKKVAVAFGKISMINSLGMSEIIECFEIADTDGGEIWFVDVGGMVRPILEAAGVLDLAIGTVSQEEIRSLLKG